jgi:uncharacterized protein (TIGR03437 family)
MAVNTPLEVLYAGQAPGSVAGLVQVNVRLPEVVQLPLLPVSLKFGPWGPFTCNVYVQR